MDGEIVFTYPHRGSEYEVVIDDYDEATSRISVLSITDTGTGEVVTDAFFQSGMIDECEDDFEDRCRDRGIDDALDAIL